MFRLNNYYKLGVVSSIMYTYTKAFGPLAYLIIVYNKKEHCGIYIAFAKPWLFFSLIIC